MKTELFVIVAIILLCTWCVYILVRMNGSQRRDTATSKFAYQTNKDTAYHDTQHEPYIRDTRDHRESLFANHSQLPRNYALNSDERKNNSRHLRMNNNPYNYNQMYPQRTIAHQFGNQYQPSDIDYEHVQPNYDNRLRSFGITDQRYNKFSNNDQQYHIKPMYQAPYESSSIEQTLSTPANEYTQNVVRANIPEPSVVTEQRNGRQLKSRIIYSNDPTALSINDTLKFASMPLTGRANQGLTSLGPGLDIVNATTTTNSSDGDSGATDHAVDDDVAESDESNEPNNEDEDENVTVDERSDDVSYNEVENESRDNRSAPSLADDNSTIDADRVEQSSRRTSDNEDENQSPSDQVATHDYDENENEQQQESEADREKKQVPYEKLSTQKSNKHSSKKSNKDKDLHRHNLTESMVSKRWDDESPEMIRKKKMQAQQDSNDNDDDEDSIPFLELDKKSSPFANIILGRFKRQLQPMFDDEMTDSIHARSDDSNRSHDNDSNDQDDRARGPTKDATDVQIRFEPEPQALAISTINAPQAPIYDYRYPSGVRRRRPALVRAVSHGHMAQPEYAIEGHEKQYESSPTEHHSSKSKSGQSKLKRSHKLKSSKAIKRGDVKHKKYAKNSSHNKKGKEFKGVKMGKKAIKGHGRQGGKKGLKFYKDKGYKKRGFKNRYHKEESGDHKTYFDEFRDKDFKKKYKKFDDNYDYKQMKKWLGRKSEKKKKLKDQGEKHKKSSKGKWKKDHKSSSKKKSEYVKSGHGAKSKKI